MSDLYLGIDTSNYKTSVAVTDSCNRVVYERSEYLEVPHGTRGLRQSEVFFMHSNRLPSFIKEAAFNVDFRRLKAAGVSTRPRRVEGSYMPCFLAGYNAASEISSSLNIPLYEFSHQEGHAAAVMEDPDSSDALRDSILMHLSGGTTEFLLCRPDEAGYDTCITGGSLDISFGQLIDRIGVAMGLPFPSGAYLDELAVEYAGNAADHIKLPAVKIKDGYFNLSGIETSIIRNLPDMDENAREALPSAVLGLIAGILIRSADELSARCGSGTVWMAGGVASSEYIRSIIERQKGSADIRFGKPSLSGDNAVGIARLAHRLQENK